MQLAALTASILVILSVIAILSLFYSAPPPQQPTTTAKPTATERPTTITTYTPASAEGVIVSNPPGSGSDTSKTFNPPYVRLVIGHNNTVIWSNDDLVPHTVTSAERLFDYRLQPGERRSHTFIKAGLYRYSCTLHPWMTGVVEIVE